MEFKKIVSLAEKVEKENLYGIDVFFRTPTYNPFKSYPMVCDRYAQSRHVKNAADLLAVVKYAKDNNFSKLRVYWCGELLYKEN